MSWQVALKWVLQQNATFVVGTGNPAHMVSDSQLFHFNLSAAEVVALADQYRPSPSPSAPDPPSPSSASRTLVRAPREAHLQPAAPFGLVAFGAAATAAAAVFRWSRRDVTAPASLLV